MSALGELRDLGRQRGGPRIEGRATDNRIAILFLAPWLLGVICITLGPVLASLYLAFTNYNLLQAPKFTGLANIQRMFSDDRLGHALTVTFTYVLVSVPLQLLAALMLAILLDRGIRGLSFYRSVLYLPSLIGGSVAIAVLWRLVFGEQGLFNMFLSFFGITGPSWVASPDTALGTIILLHVWTFGAPMVIFLAGLRQIPREFYEAAVTDGAGPIRQMRYITLPLLTPIIFFNLVLGLIGSFQSFTQAYIVSGGSGGPADSTLFFSLYLYEEGFSSFRMGYASALAWLLLIIIGVFTALNFWASKYWVFTMTRTDPVPVKAMPRQKQSHHRSMRVRTGRRRWISVMKHSGLILIAVTMLYPVLWMFVSSVRPNSDIFGDPGLIVDTFDFAHYPEGWNALAQPFSTYLLNSAVIVLGSVLGNLFSCSLAAYAFARLNFRFKKAAFVTMLVTIMLPIHVLIIPQYVLYSKLGWINTYLPLIVPKFLATDAFFVFLMVQFIRGIPRELDEAARIDGAGHVRIFTLIMLPLMVPALATTAIFTFIWSWNDFFSQLVFVTEPDLYTVPVALRSFLDSQAQSDYGALFAMSVVSLIPMFLVFLFGQRFLIRGIATTGGK